ncbi:restriction endonuclease subunit S [bacterium]|nr:restriction endonuclease subunit S [bacterium]
MTPRDWSVHELGSLFELKSGNTPSKKDSENWGGCYPWVTAKDMQKSQISATQLSLTQKGSELAKHARAGSLLVLTRGMTLFKRLPVVLLDAPASFNQDVKELRPKRTEVLDEYSLLLMQAMEPKVLQMVDAAGHGTGRLDTHRLKALPLPLPPKSQQSQIVQTINLWSQAIACCQKLIENARQQKKALAQQLLTGKRRLPGFSCAARHLTPVGELPTDWDVISIGRVATEVSVRNNSGAKHTVLACSKHVGFVNSLEYFKKQVFSEDLSGYKVIKRGQFGFPSNHVEEGSIGLQDVTDIGLVSPIYTVFETDPDRVDAGYLFKLLKTEHYRQRFAASTNASVDRRGSLRWAGFRSIKIPLPSLDEQKAIAKVLDLAAELESGYEAYRAKLELEKRALMQQLLTGKRRVPLLDESEADA